jgi:cytoskeletal protein CcmA (bactofilin family)
MSLHGATPAFPAPSTALRFLVTLSLLTLVLVAVLAPPAHALERQVFGDVVVRPGEQEEHVSTSFGDVTVNGSVSRDVRSAFGDVKINESVGGNVEAGSGDIDVHAPVGGTVDAGFGDVYVNSKVGGDVDVDHGDVRLGPHARVGGNVHYSSGEFFPEPGSQVQGQIVTGMDPDFDHDPVGPGPLGRLVGWAFAAAAFVAVSVLAVVVAPGTLSATARRAEESPGWSLFVGVASVPAMVILSVALAVSLVGIPLVLLLTPAYLALVFFGALVAAYFIGRKVVLATGRYRVGNAMAAAVGALIVAAVTLIPLVGNLIVYALALLGTGATILALLSRRSGPAYPSYEAYVRDRRDA